MFVIWQKWSSLFLDANEGLDYRQQSEYGMDKYYNIFVCEADLYVLMLSISGCTADNLGQTVLVDNFGTKQ